LIFAQKRSSISVEEISKEVIIMTTVNICLDSIDKVKSFVNEITRFDSDFDLISGRYVIDAKSIMGIFSLDLSKPIELTIHNDDADDILATLAPYIVQ
jgi:phosphotransferase system HPr-like phosphotransfer protein